jgi:glycosyltransferase involved in cell wall biosynthesis
VNSSSPELPADERTLAIMPTVAVLLGTFNGEAFLRQQLDSIEAQTFADWKVWVSDDGSSDGTAAMLAAYGKRWGAARWHVQAGPAHGFAANFLCMACRPDIQAELYAYCDQDDEWLPEKLQRAVEWLRQQPASVPALYCSRTELIDAQGTLLGYSPHFTGRPGFGNALVQTLGGGNTMVFNQAARLLLCQMGTVDVAFHDWWTYLVVSGAGGAVHYDPRPSLRYRQYANNVLGSNRGWAASKKRVQMMFHGSLREWSDRNVRALLPAPFLSASNRRALEIFARARNGWLLPRLWGMLRAGIYRQTLLGNCGLVLAALFKKL